MIKKLSKYYLSKMIIEARKYCNSLDNRFHNMCANLEANTGVAFYIYSDLILSCLRLGASSEKIIDVFKLLGFEVVYDDKKDKEWLE